MESIDSIKLYLGVSKRYAVLVLASFIFSRNSDFRFQSVKEPSVLKLLTANIRVSDDKRRSAIWRALWTATKPTSPESAYYMASELRLGEVPMSNSKRVLGSGPYAATDV